MQLINSEKTFNNLVDWFVEEIINKHNAPGFLIGLSGTDSLIAFCAAATALNKVNKDSQMLGVHFTPSEDYLYDYPEAETHLWFQNQIIPWLRAKFPKTNIIIDTSIDWRYDGLRWGRLLDMSVVLDKKDNKRVIRSPEEQYWVIGTRNKTEDVLKNYSNASIIASIQPIIHLWKSEILELAEYLQIPQIAVKKSCETDCICGRDQIGAQYVKQIDLVLMRRNGDIPYYELNNKVPKPLQDILDKFINDKLDRNSFKDKIPYIPNKSIIEKTKSLVEMFESASLPLSEFNHYKHLEIAWYYLKRMSFDHAFCLYSGNLIKLLRVNLKEDYFNIELTKQYFEKIQKAIKETPTNSFEELVKLRPDILDKINL